MPDVTGAKVTPIPSFMTRLVQGARYAIQGVGPDSWFGPNQPLQPMAPDDVKGRQFNYPVGSNLNYTPRTTENISFAELRALADNLPLLRLVIETRKDQVASMKWLIKPRGMQPGKFSSKQTLDDPRIKALTDFFLFPDRRNNFDTWLRMLLEELFVIDAAAVYPRMTRGGGVYSLELIDGSTLKPLIGFDGRPPVAPDPAYQQILHGIPAADFTADELLYLPRNRRVNRVYGFSPCEQLVLIVNIALRRDIFTLNYYKEGTIPEAFGTLPKEWTTQQIQQFQGYFDSLMTDNLADRRKLRFMPADFKFQEVRQPPLKDVYDEWLARVICYAFSVPPNAFVHQVNRATADNLTQQAQTEGLVPIQNWLKATFDLLIARYFGMSDLEFAWDDSWTVNPLARSQADQIDVTTGIKTADEVRDERGLPPLPKHDPAQPGGTPPSPADLAALAAKNEKPGLKDEKKPAEKLAAEKPAEKPAEKLAADEELEKYSPNQPRDSHGRFGATGGSAGTIRGRRRKPKEVAGAKWEATTPAGVRVEAGVKIAKAAALGAASYYAGKAVSRMATGGWKTAAGFVVATMVGTSIHWGLSSVHALLEQAADALGIPREHADRAIEHMRSHVYTIVDAFIPPSVYKSAEDDMAVAKLLEYAQKHAHEVLGPGAEAIKADVRAKAREHLKPEQYVEVDHGVDAAQKAITEAISAAIHDVHSGKAEKLAKAQEEWPAGKKPKAKHVRGLSSLWQEIFSREAKKAAAAFRAAHPEKLAAMADDPEFYQFVEDRLTKIDPDDTDLTGYEDDVAEAIAEAAADGGGVGLNELFDRMGSPASAELRTAVFERSNKRAQDWARKRAAELVSGVEETTRVAIRRTISKGLEEGLSIAEIADDIESSQAFSDERSELIAETEVANANSHGAVEGYRAAADEGLKVKKRWVLAVGACPLCQENAEAGAIDLDEEFPNGVLAPTQHPHCLPGDSLVLARGIRAVSKRFYEGDLVVIRTARGNYFRSTPNHPVMTNEGWVAAGELHVGSNIVCQGVSERKLGSDPECEDVPARIEDIAEAFFSSREVASTPVPVSTPDFHGDGAGSEVAVVGAYRDLLRGRYAALCEHHRKAALVRADVGSEVSIGLDAASDFNAVLERLRPAADGVMSRGNLGGPLLGSHLRPPERLGFGLAADMDPGFEKAPTDAASVDSVLLGYGQLGQAADVVGDDVLVDYVEATARAVALFGETALDTVVYASRIQYVGHVYNLETESSIYIANSAVTHNCRCATSAVVEEGESAGSDEVELS